MTILENKTRSTVLPAVWITAVSGLILVVYLMGLQTSNRGNSPLHPILAGLSFHFDQDSPSPDFGVSGVGQLFALIEQIIPSDSEYSDYFGASVSISGNTAVIGAPQRDDQGLNTGAAYVLEWDVDGQTWIEVKKLFASDAGDNGNFGANAKVFGDTLFVSGFDLFASTNKLYVFERDFGGQDNWGEIKIIIPSEASEAARFGATFDFNNDLLFVGAYHDNSPAIGQGSAFIFDRNLGGQDNWGEVMKIEPPAANAFWFGHSVSVSGDTLVIGAPSSGSIGKAYIFEQNQGGQGNWGLVTTLIPPNGEDSFLFGETVAVDGDDAFVGSSSAGIGDFIYMYERDQGGADNWGIVAELHGVDYGASFGYPVVGQLDQGRLFLHAINLGDPLGRVLIFEQDSGGPANWGLVQTIEPESTNEVGDNYFGQALAYEEGNLILGHPGSSIGSTPFRGSGFFYQEGAVTATPSPTPSNTPSPTVSPTVSTTPTATASPTGTPSPTATPTDQMEEFLSYLPLIVR